ncbi:MAG: TIGR01212 family radical SAM protein, partial [Treponema sp.]|nr:TIGR01212 family radical SAM protein [Treponema sp.]
GCTCPNRDGTKGVGGCIFCSEQGSGDFVPGREKPIEVQVSEAKARIESKLRGRSGGRRGKYIAYFQNFSSTYGDEDALIKKYDAALFQSDVVGIAIATRPDCIGEKIFSWISEKSRETFVQIELGLQSSKEETGRLINRCSTNGDYESAVSRLMEIAPDAHIVTHLIFGLPGESERDMMESVRFVRMENMRGQRETRTFGVKITVLYVVSRTVLCAMYERGEYECLSKESYFSLVKKALSLLGGNCIIHRLTGDPPKRVLVAPAWTADKKRVMNELKSFLAGDSVV